MIIAIGFSSCKGYSITWSEYLANEFKYYDFNEGSSILDFSGEQRSIPALIATSKDNLHFYLGYGARAKYGRLSSQKIPQDMFEDFKKKYNSNNHATFTIVEQARDSLLLADKSIDYILCRNYLQQFDSFTKIIEEWRRVLKPKGDLYLKGQFQELIELPNFQPLNSSGLIQYFEKNGFKLIRSDNVVYNRHMEKVTKGGLTLLHFQKE